MDAKLNWWLFLNHWLVSIHAPVMDAKSIVTACDGEVELVSIHAPVMDAKTVATTTRHSNVVSIHAPVMDANNFIAEGRTNKDVSIHAPVMDANNRSTTYQFDTMFQSTRP